MLSRLFLVTASAVTGFADTAHANPIILGVSDIDSVQVSRQMVDIGFRISTLDNEEITVKRTPAGSFVGAVTIPYKRVGSNSRDNFSGQRITETSCTLKDTCVPLGSWNYEFYLGPQLGVSKSVKVTDVDPTCNVNAGNCGCRMAGAWSPDAPPLFACVLGIAYALRRNRRITYRSAPAKHGSSDLRA